MLSILITGSLGVIGRPLSRELIKKGHNVFGIDISHNIGEVGYTQKMSNSEFSYSRCDISEFRQLERVFKIKKFDIVYNCAAEFGRWNGEDYYEQVWKTNVIGLKHILNLQTIYGFKLIHFSSSEVYGDYDKIMKEDLLDQIEIKQLNDYAISKWTNEQQIKNHNIFNDGLDTVVVRIFNTYGPGEYYHPYRSVNSKFVYNLLHKIPIDVYKNHSRTSTYLSDTVRTIANISQNFISGETYNIGGNELHSIEELADLIIKYTDCSKSLVKYKNNEEILTTKTKIVDVSKSIKDLDHKNSVSLDEGVRKTVDWMKKIYKI
jgi:dTDP-glucose 4,6-dehydratase